MAPSAHNRPRLGTRMRSLGLALRASPELDRYHLTGPVALPTDANVIKREDFQPRRLRSDANVTKREDFQRRTSERGVLGRLRRHESWAFAGGTPPAALSRLRKLRVLLHLQHGTGSAAPKLRVLLHLHQALSSAGRVAGLTGRLRKSRATPAAPDRSRSLARSGDV